MNKFKRILAGVSSLTALMTAFSCSGGKNDSSQESSTEEETTVPVSETAEELVSPDISGQEIVWLADYDLNPSSESERSTALTLFEDVYGGHIKYVYTPPEEKFSRLESMVLSGEEVDMFPYDAECIPNGVKNGQFEALDPYFGIMGIDGELWDSIRSVSDMFAYNGEHYVVPYSISDPVLLTYSRQLMREEGLDDPYELFKAGNWNWDSFMSMMEKFKANTPEGEKRYGINGFFGQAMAQSSGHTVINSKDGVFENNIEDPQTEKAVSIMCDIAAKDLYSNEWTDYFPDDKSTLFFAMGDWSLGNSNAKNPNAELMIVPFPKSPDSEKNSLSCNYNAKMLVKSSSKAEAVATYIRCERIAAADPQYSELAKKNALVVRKTSENILKYFMTEEQYNVLQSYLNLENVSPVLDFGFGMGEKMYGNGNYTAETRGVMNNLEACYNAVLEGNMNLESFREERKKLKAVTDEQLRNFNN